MTVLASLYSGISGITSNGSAMSVSGDNIANINTTAFKAGSALFESNLTQKIGNVEVGLGSRLAATNTAFTQGAFASSSRALDLAIQGDGFFAVEDTQGARFYTRAGSLTKNQSGELVTTVGGFALQGYQVDEDTGIASSTPTNIDLNSVNSSPQASTTISADFNLDPSAEIVSDPFDGTSFSSAENTSNFSIPSVMYDSRGTAREVITYFRRTADNNWEYYSLTELDNLQDDAGGNWEIDPNASSDATVVMAAGDLSFDTDGTLDTSSVTTDGNSVVAWHLTSVAGNTASLIEAGQILTNSTDATISSDVPWAGADPLSLDPNDTSRYRFDLGQVSGGSGSVTQFETGSGSTVNLVEKDGRSVGELQSLEITNEGTIRGNFSNGDSRNLYEIPIATFANTEGLSRIGSNVYQETSLSGAAVLGNAGSTGRGVINSFQLEQSNVDLASEFVKIIQFQRGFQASARNITSASDLLQELVNLGR